MIRKTIDLHIVTRRWRNKEKNLTECFRDTIETTTYSFLFVPIYSSQRVLARKALNEDEEKECQALE